MIIFNLIVGPALLDEVLYIDNCQLVDEERERGQKEERQHLVISLTILEDFRIFMFARSSFFF